MDADHEGYVLQQSENQHDHVAAVLVPPNRMDAAGGVHVGLALVLWPPSQLPLLVSVHVHLPPQQHQNQHGNAADLVPPNPMEAAGGVHARARPTAVEWTPRVADGFGPREYAPIDVVADRNIIILHLGPENIPWAGRVWAAPVGPETPTEEVAISIDPESNPFAFPFPFPWPGGLWMAHNAEGVSMYPNNNNNNNNNNNENNNRPHNPIAYPRLNWAAEMMIVFSLAAATQMTEKLISGSSSSSSDPVGDFLSRTSM